ncbi:unnamed protein product [Eruca vesicaria subsp. sativa]|uniref:Wax synthase domain-containing protein n=1 Tax=Eruca vesicaria subsp. sativa TaxID=29727 RepID=A0ABC8LNB1_ERUVS|nr:unnamed protein product [Eruca vesicaria subsp. sativa]
MVSFISAWCLVIVSLCYTYVVARLVPKGIRRMILFIPVFLYFFIVPLSLSTIHSVGITAFFISWLANFKIFLFAFGRGPLASDSKPLALPIFLAVSCLPIKIHLNPKPTTSSYSHGGSSREGLLYYSIRAGLLLLLTKVYTYSSKLPNKAVLALYAIHIYLSLEIILSATATMVRAMSSLELETQFNKPYLATSLQEFWGRRWNLAVSGILRPTVYEPMVQLFSILGPNWSQATAVFATFVVSGLMHELLFFYMGGLMPDWKVMWFFLIHGFCTTVEIAMKKKVNGRWRLPTVVSRVLIFGFVMVTGLWLFLPVFKRGNMFERILEEYAYAGAVAAEIKSIITSLI